MNPKGVNDLDPKLKEAYDRIMGTALNPVPQNTQPQQPAAPNLAPAAAAQTPPPAPAQAPTTPVNEPTPPSTNTPLMQTQVFTQSAPLVDNTPAQNITPAEPSSIFTQSPSSNAQPQKKKLNLLPILFVVGGLIFFGVYIVVWAKVFGLF